MNDGGRVSAPVSSGLAPGRLTNYHFAMSTSELIQKEVSALPEPLRREVYDFPRFLRQKNHDDSFNGPLLGESALGREWNTPEDDAVWVSR